MAASPENWQNTTRISGREESFMEESARFFIIFATEEQANDAKQIILDSFKSVSGEPERECAKRWLEQMVPTEDGKGFIIKDYAYIMMKAYEGLVLNFCMEIASRYPKYRFELWADGADSWGLLCFDEHCLNEVFMDEVSFSYSCVKEFPAIEGWEDMDPDSFALDDDKSILSIYVDGKCIDDKMQFTRKEILDETDDDDFDDEDEEYDEDY